MPDELDVHIDALTERVIGCGIEVHRMLGPGLLESIYRDCMVIELRAQPLDVRAEWPARVVYKGHQVRGDLKIDLLVNRCLVVEVKAVERIHPVHLAQVITYLKITGCPAGLILNFNTTTLRSGLRRLDHPDLYRKRRPPSLAPDNLTKGR